MHNLGLIVADHLERLLNSEALYTIPKYLALSSGAMNLGGLSEGETVVPPAHDSAEVMRSALFFCRLRLGVSYYPFIHLNTVQKDFPNFMQVAATNWKSAIYATGIQDTSFSGLS